MTPHGFHAEVGEYKVLSDDDEILVYSPERGSVKHRIRGLEKFVSQRVGELKVSIGRTRDFEILYIYDQRDGFGYAINLDAPELSEWGYAPVDRERHEESEHE